MEAPLYSTPLPSEAWVTIVPSVPENGTGAVSGAHEIGGDGA